MSRIRVAMVGLRAPWGTEGGVEQVVGELAPRLVARGCEVTVYCRRRYNPLGEGVHQGVRLVDLDTLYTKHLEAIVHTGLALPLAIRGADVVHLHATGPALLSWLPRLAGRATVVTVHGLDWKRDKWGPVARGALWVGAWAAGAVPHRVIAVGQHLASHFRAAYGADAVYLPNGVGEIPEVPLGRAGVDGLKPRGYALFVGRIVPEKALEQLLEAWDALRPDLPLVIVGGANYAEEYLDWLRALAPPGVIFAGPRFGESRDALLRNARFFVYPSRIEGLPVAPLEALSAGLPVLLSDIAPHREILRAGEQDWGAGWLVPSGGWAAALRCALEATPEALQAMGQAGAALVRARFGWDNVADRTVEVYREALALAGRGPGGL